MDPNPEAQQQPTYPQQYPPQDYRQPYYQPYPPPKKDDEKTTTMIIVILILVLVVPMIMAAVLYVSVIDPATTDYPPSSQVPVGTWGAKTTRSATSVSVDFGKVNPEPKPVDLFIILIRNQTAQGTYIFTSNRDGFLGLTAGTDIAFVEYRDLADNEWVNMGDNLLFTGLSPNSDYSLKMLWEATGDQITSTTFSTPA